MDTANHVITHIQAFHADKSDGNCLPEVLKSTIENLRENGIGIKEVLADAGYSSVTALQTLIDNNIEGYIPNVSGYKAIREGFFYNKENDSYTCSQGKTLTFRRFRMRGEHKHKIYQSRTKDCQNCPFKDTCANPVGIKSLEDSVSKDIYDQMHQRMQTSKGRTMRRLRSSTVEPVLGTLINVMGMKQVNTKGIKLANKCMLLAAVAYNLKKLINGVPVKARKRAWKTFNITVNDLRLGFISCINRIITTIGLFSIKCKKQMTVTPFAFY